MEVKAFTAQVFPRPPETEKHRRVHIREEITDEAVLLERRQLPTPTYEFEVTADASQKDGNVAVYDLRVRFVEGRLDDVISAIKLAVDNLTLDAEPEVVTEPVPEIKVASKTDDKP